MSAAFDQRVTRAVALSRTIESVCIGAGVLREVPLLLERHFARPSRVCIVADENTWSAAGGPLEERLVAAGIAVARHVLPGRPRPRPSLELARAIAARLAIDDAIPICVGSGVLNDLVKFAAFELDRPYLCVASAASMDGYASAGAPLSDAGFKKTIACRPARVIVGDLDVITAAPARMNGWGYGDLAGKLPAGADWLVADALGIEPLDDVAWPLVQSELRAWLGAADAIGAAEPAALDGLFRGLTLVGLAMELHGSSRPASGADHQIAHLWEMEHLEHEGEAVSHGACVAIGCLTVTALYDWLLDQDLARIDVAALTAAAPTLDQQAARVRGFFGTGEVASKALIESEAKHLEGAALHAHLERVRQAWPVLRDRLRAQLLPASRLRRWLRAAGAPSAPAAIGVSPQHLRRTVLAAPYLRSRYTVLDLLLHVGLLEPALDAALAVLTTVESE